MRKRENGSRECNINRLLRFFPGHQFINKVTFTFDFETRRNFFWEGNNWAYLIPQFQQSPHDIFLNKGGGNQNKPRSHDLDSLENLGNLCVE